MLTPFTKLLSGGCHWNRDTAKAVAEAGFRITSVRRIWGGLQPGIIIQAERP
jgi:hypothetical protein